MLPKFRDGIVSASLPTCAISTPHLSIFISTSSFLSTPLHFRHIYPIFPLYSSPSSPYLSPPSSPLISTCSISTPPSSPLPFSTCAISTPPSSPLPFSTCAISTLSSRSSTAVYSSGEGSSRCVPLGR